jgi:hypothetical protein
MLGFGIMKLFEVLSDKKLLSSLCIFIVLKIFLIADSFPAQTDSDSGSYTSGSGFTNWGWVSFSGDSHGRGWPTVLIYSLVQDNAGRILLQQFLSLFSWLFFILSVYMLISELRIKSFWLLIVGVVALAPYSQLFNNWIGRESIALSFSLISISLLSFFIRYRHPFVLMLMFLMVGLAIITKPSLMLLGAALLVVAIYFESEKKQLSKLRIFSWFFCFVFISYTFVNVGNQNEGWGKADPTGRTANEIVYSYLVSDFNPNQESLRTYFSSIGAPTCATQLSPSTQSNLGAPMEHAGMLHGSCEGFSEFVKNSFMKGYLTYVLLNPEHSIQLVASQIGSAIKLNGGQGWMSSGQSIFENLLFSTYLFDSFVFCCFLGVILGLAFRSRDLKRRLDFRFMIAFTAISMGSVASIVFSLLLMPTHASDLARQNWVASLLFRLMLVVMFLLVFQAQMQRKKIV